MSKANHALTTSSGQAHSRRDILANVGPAVLAGALAVSAVDPSNAGPSPIDVRSAEAQALIAEIAKCREQSMTALDDMNCLEDESPAKGKPGFRRYVAAKRKFKERENEYAQLVDRILRAPVRTWEDVGIRAELSRYFREGMGSDTLEARVINGLRDAALTMAGLPPIPPEPRGWSDEEWEAILAARDRGGAPAVMEEVERLRANDGRHG